MITEPSYCAKQNISFWSFAAKKTNSSINSDSYRKSRLITALETSGTLQKFNREQLSRIPDINENFYLDFSFFSEISISKEVDKVHCTTYEGYPAKLIVETLSVIEKIWPDAYSELQSIVSGIVFKQEKYPLGFSDPAILGVLFYSVSLKNLSPIQFASYIVHEVGHQSLFVECSKNRIFEGSESTPLYSPLRDETRTQLGVLHSAIAISRMANWNKLVLESTNVKLDKCTLKSIENDFFKLIYKYESTIQLLETIKFQVSGNRILKDMTKDFNMLKDFK